MNRNSNSLINIYHIHYYIIYIYYVYILKKELVGQREREEKIDMVKTIIIGDFLEDREWVEGKKEIIEENYSGTIFVGSGNKQW